MRTTIEIPDRLRARLLALAARRGEKGYSRLVEEAIARYLEEWEGRAKVVRDAQAAMGSLSEAEADALEESVKALRERWR
jgi:metal-responsive CopG/Arc/MetJ family transcriptional regulator